MICSGVLPARVSCGLTQIDFPYPPLLKVEAARRRLLPTHSNAGHWRLMRTIQPSAQTCCALAPFLNPHIEADTSPSNTSGRRMGSHRVQCRSKLVRVASLAPSWWLQMPVGAGCKIPIVVCTADRSSPIKDREGSPFRSTAWAEAGMQHLPGADSAAGAGYDCHLPDHPHSKVRQPASTVAAAKHTCNLLLPYACCYCVQEAEGRLQCVSGFWAFEASSSATGFLTAPWKPYFALHITTPACISSQSPQVRESPVGSSKHPTPSTATNESRGPTCLRLAVRIKAWCLLSKSWPSPL